MSTDAPPASPTAVPPPLRLWPGIAAAVLLCLVRFVVPLVLPEATIISWFGALACALVILLWWLFFSRAPWLERLGVLALIIIAVPATKRVVHESIAGGMMGMMLPLMGLPIVCLLLVIAVWATQRQSAGVRRAAVAAGILVACGVFMLVRTGGMTGAADSDLHWRWTPTPEQRLLAQKPEVPPAAPRAAVGSTGDRRIEPAAITIGAPVQRPAEWPGFRGPGRDGVVRGERIATDWARTPPKELWRRPVGPGWSSFAVHGDLFYTQEQLGDDEIVACYQVSTGEVVWQHRDAARFWESNAGAGPRATPTLSDGRVYTFGATGLVNALDARDGSVIWTRNAATDTRKNVPGWGFAGSPLVVGDLVVVAAGGKLVAYERATGKLRWIGPAGGWGYSSPHQSTIAGVAQVLLLNGAGAISVGASNGKLLWEHAWSGDGIVQPAVTANGDVLIGTGSGLGASAKVGLRCVAVSREADAWKVEERWTTNRLKPYFNDFVMHRGHAFGFDGSALACIDLKDGERKWKGGRYGSGQAILLADQDLLLVISEQGDLALVRAAADEFKEVARVPAIKGKTWNHPVLAGQVLLVRNSEEMAAFRLP